MSFYTIDFTVAADGVTPTAPQMAGHVGDHRAALVRFSVPFTGYQYRLEISDGGGGYDTTGLLNANQGVVSYEIPCAWTMPGVATLRLVAVEQDQDGNEIVRFHSAPAYLCFADREEGEPLCESARPAWQETLDEAQLFLNAVEQKLANGELKGEKGDKGDKGDKGEKGVDGTVAFSDLTAVQRESLRGDKGEKGDQGDDYVLTDEDKYQIVEWVLHALPIADEVGF